MTTQTAELQQIVSNSTALAGSLRVQLDTLRAEAEQHEARLSDVDAKAQAHQDYIGRLQEELEDTRARLKAAELSKLIAKNTSAEASIKSSIKALQQAVKDQEHALADAVGRTAEVAAQCEAERVDVVKTIEQTQAAISALEAQLHIVEHEQVSAHEALGQAQFAALQQEIADCEEKLFERRREMLLLEACVRQLKHQAPAQLHQWPALAEQAREQWEEPPSMTDSAAKRIYNDCLKLLKSLELDARHAPGLDISALELTRSTLEGVVAPDSRLMVNRSVLFERLREPVERALNREIARTRQRY